MRRNKNCATPTEFIGQKAQWGKPVKLQHYERFDVLYCPPDVEAMLWALGGVASTRPGVKFEIPIETNVRNRENYRTALVRDLAAFRSKGAIIEGVLTQAGKDALDRGKVLDNRRKELQEQLTSLDDEIAKYKADNPVKGDKPKPAPTK